MGFLYHHTLIEGSDNRGDGGGGGRLAMEVSVFSLNIDLSFFMLCVGARPLSFVRLKKRIISYKARFEK